MHGDARRAEDQQQDDHVDDAGRLPRRPQDPRGVPQPRARQVKRKNQQQQQPAPRSLVHGCDDRSERRDDYITIQKTKNQCQRGLEEEE